MNNKKAIFYTFIFGIIIFGIFIFIFSTNDSKSPTLYNLITPIIFGRCSGECILKFYTYLKQK